MFRSDINFYRLLEYGGEAINIAYRRYDASPFRLSFQNQEWGNRACICSSDNIHGTYIAGFPLWGGLSGGRDYLPGRN